MSNNNTLESMLTKFMPFAQKRMGFKSVPEIHFESDVANAQNPLGKTAYYEPDSSRITVYVDGRHPKDIMRSISHELVHHAQNGRGDFANNEAVGEQGYAQNDEHLREMEREAYEQGNLCFRDWEDSIKAQQNEELDMFEKRNNKLNESIMKKFGYATEAEVLSESIKGLGLDDNWRQLPPEEYVAMEKKVDVALGKILGQERWASVRGANNERYDETLEKMLKDIIMIGETHYFGTDSRGENNFLLELQKLFNYDGRPGPYAFQKWLIEKVAEAINNIMTPGRKQIDDLVPELQEGVGSGDAYLSAFADKTEERLRKINALPPTTLYKDKRTIGDEYVPPLASKVIIAALDGEKLLDPEKRLKFLSLPIKDMTEVAFKLTGKENILQKYKQTQGRGEAHTYKPEDMGYNAGTPLVTKEGIQEEFVQDEKGEEYRATLDRIQAQNPEMTVPEIEAGMVDNDPADDSIGSPTPISGSGGERYEVGDTIRDEDNRTGEILELTAYGAIAQFVDGAGPEKIRFKHMTKAAGDKELARPEEGDEVGFDEAGLAEDESLRTLEEEFPEAFQVVVGEDGGGCAEDPIQISVGEEEGEEVTVMTQESEDDEQDDNLYSVRNNKLHEQLKRWSTK